jgi:hypothetical protein
MRRKRTLNQSIFALYKSVNLGLKGPKLQAIAQLLCRAEWGPLCDPDVCWVKSALKVSTIYIRLIVNKSVD